MKRKRVIGGIVIVLIFLVVVTGLNSRAGRMTVPLSFIGYTNVTGTTMALLKVQNKQSRRIWLREAYYLLDNEFQQPLDGWQCSMYYQALSNRWAKIPPGPLVPEEYLPPHPTPTSPDPADFMVPVPTNQPLWRIGVLVEFNTRLPDRIRVAWKTRDASSLKKGYFINNSLEAIWVESPVITNAVIIADSAVGGAGAQRGASPNVGPVVAPGSSNGWREDLHR